MEKNLFILLRIDFDELPPVVEGYFTSVRKAKKYIKDNQYNLSDCQLYKLKSSKDYL